MDEVLAQYLDGKIEREEFDTKLQALPEAERAEFDTKLADPEVVKKITSRSKEELEKITALRKEGKRLSEKKPDEIPVQSDFASKLREENVEMAKKDFYAKFNIPDDEKASYEEEFKANDSGHVGVDLIVADFRKIYAARNSDTLLDIQDKYNESKAGADDFNASHAGAPGGTGDPNDGDAKKFSPEVHAWVAESRRKGSPISLEDAQKVLDRGLTRVIG